MKSAIASIKISHDDMVGPIVEDCHSYFDVKCGLLISEEESIAQLMIHSVTNFCSYLYNVTPHKSTQIYLIWCGIKEYLHREPAIKDSRWV